MGGVAVRIVLVGLLACLTVRQQAAWESNVALWSQAVVVAPLSPRAAFNLALSYRFEGDIDRSLVWLDRSALLAINHPRKQDFDRLIRLQIDGLAMLGTDVCSTAWLSAYC